MSKNQLVVAYNYLIILQFFNDAAFACTGAVFGREQRGAHLYDLQVKGDYRLGDGSRIGGATIHSGDKYQ
jgi:hypothetical protein